MGELRIHFEIDGFDRVIYEEEAKWEKCTLSMEDNSKASVQMWEDSVDDREQLKSACTNIRERIQRLVLAFEWAYGRKLRCKIVNVNAPLFENQADPFFICESIALGDETHGDVGKRKVPEDMPEVPLESERWVATMTEANEFKDYVEEQLRRQYLIIEELWCEFKDRFETGDQIAQQKVKLMRDFVSHSYCCNTRIVNLVAPGLPSSVITINGRRCVMFKRTVEHRNYVAHFEAISRKLARSLVQIKMQQFGRVVGI